MTARLPRAALAFLILCGAFVSAHPSAAQARQANPPIWSYSGTNGPDHWSDLDPAFAACKPASDSLPSTSSAPNPPNLPPSNLITRSRR